jgi:DNA-binding NarL/FixJ family response regulator
MVRTLILTADTSPKVAFRALRAGADGFILKEGICGRLDAAIDTVLAGNRYVDPAVAGDALLLAQSSERAETPA